MYPLYFGSAKAASTGIFPAFFPSPLACLLARTNDNRHFERPFPYTKKPPQTRGILGVPDWIRTNGTKRRRLVLYPTELRIRFAFIFYYFCLPFSKRFFPLFQILLKYFSPPPFSLSFFSSLCYNLKNRRSV